MRGRAAVEEDGELLQLLGDRRDREAVAARDVADHRVDVLALDQVAELGHLLRGAAGLVDEDELRSGGRRSPSWRRAPGIFPPLSASTSDLGAVARRDAERAGGGAGEEGDDAELERRRLAAAGAWAGAWLDEQQGEGEREQRADRRDVSWRILGCGWSNLEHVLLRRGSPAGKRVRGEATIRPAGRDVLAAGADDLGRRLQIRGGDTRPSVRASPSPAESACPARPRRSPAPARPGGSRDRCTR